MHPAEPFGDLEGENHVGGPLLDQRRMDLLPEAHVARHDAAALGHPVDLALLRVEPHHLGDLAEHLAREEHALAAHTHDQYVRRAVFHFIPSFARRAAPIS